MTLVSLALSDAVKRKAVDLGFDHVSIGPADPVDHAAEFNEWLDAGLGASMAYLERTRDERVDPRRLLPGARAVITVALSYHTADPEPGEALRTIARYARGRDYHDVIRPRLLALAQWLREVGGDGVESRAAIDTSAVLERDLAARAGLGWIGKNTNLLTETSGSYVFIGVVLTTAELAFDDRVPDRCGTCRACLDACPTQAFVAPYVLDARRCLSYLTIEHRGDIDARLRPSITDWLFGCDVCQDVCPWNRKAAPSREAAFAPAIGLDSLASLVELDDAGFKNRFRGTALTRAKRAGLARNAALLLGNRGDRDAIAALETALADPDAAVRAAARWALDRIAAQSSAA